MTSSRWRNTRFVMAGRCYEQTYPQKLGREFCGMNSDMMSWRYLQACRRSDYFPNLTNCTCAEGGEILHPPFMPPVLIGLPTFSAFVRSGLCTPRTSLESWRGLRCIGLDRCSSER